MNKQKVKQIGQAVQGLLWKHRWQRKVRNRVGVKLNGWGDPVNGYW